MGNPRILIIGGGVIGSAIAYFLSHKKAEVILVEQQDLASGSSGACDGLVFMQSKKPGIHLALAMESLTLFDTLSKELPFDIEFKQTGGMVAIENEAQWRAMEKFVSDQKQIGLDVRLLDRNQTLEKEPFLSPDIAGATWSPTDAQVNPIYLTLGLAMGAKQNHARIMTQTKVLDILTRNGRVTGVQTTQGKIEADIIINACGSMAGMVSRLIDLPIPIRPRRGQILVTHAGRRILNHCMISAQYIAAKFDPSLAQAGGQGISMEQTDNGNLLLGSTREFVGFNKENTLSGLKGILKQTAALLPALQSFRIIRSFAGLRPFTPDGLPLLGPVKGFDNFYMAAGHEGDGIALSPVTGKLMADLVLGKKTAFNLDDFSPSRFDTIQGTLPCAQLKQI